MFDKKQLSLLTQTILQGGNLMLLYYVPNREIINYNRVPINVFMKHFPKLSSENFSQASLRKVPPLKGVADLRP